MYTSNGADVLDFQLNFKVTKKVKKSFLSLRSSTEDFVILNDGN